MGRHIGIDLGTTTSVVAAVNGDGKPVPVANPHGGLLTPSAVLMTLTEVLVGQAAINAAAMEPQFLARRFKPHLDSSVPVFTDAKGTQHTAEDLASVLLGALKKQAEEALGEKVDGAVITVPADFPHVARDAVMRAAQRAGLRVLELISEPTAAAVAYGFDKRQDGTFMVVDQGGGTLDVSIVGVQSGQFIVAATAGDRHLGGGDFDDCMAAKVLDELKKKHGLDPDPAKEPLFFYELYEKVERAKVTLSVSGRAAVTVSLNGKTVVREFLRQEYEGLIAPFVDRIVAKAEEALKAANVGWKDLAAIVPVGGPTRTPLIRERLQKASGLPLKTDVEPDLAVALGAAVYAWKKATEKGGSIVVNGKVLRAPAVKLQDVVAHSLCAVALDVVAMQDRAVVIIPAQSAIPCAREESFALEDDNQTQVRIPVVQGNEGDPPGKCLPIGELVLSDLPIKLPRERRIGVKYAINGSGVVSVTATDAVSGKSATTDLRYGSGKVA